MKKILQILLIFTMFYSMNIKALEINSNHAILINLNEDTVLYEKNSNEITEIASLTKIMTTVVALEKIDNLDKKITLTYEDFRGLAEEHAAVAGFSIGQEVTYRDLLYGLLLPSGADAAQALTRNIGGSREEFVKLMNEKAKEIGMKDTYFVNETGLDAEGQKSTVKDLSILFKYALNNKEFNKIIKSASYTTSDQKLNFKSTLKAKKEKLNMNYLLGGKTGTTEKAGLCLASISEYNGVNYMLITTKAPYDKTTPYNFVDAKNIYEYFMNNYSYKTIINKGDILVELKLKYASKDKLKIKAPKEIKKYLSNDFKKENVKIKYSGLQELSYKNKVGDKLGKIKVYYDNKKIETINVILNEKIKFDLIKYIMSNIKIILGIIILIIIILVIIKIL